MPATARTHGNAPILTANQPSAAPASDPATAPFVTLLRVEADARAAKTSLELGHLMANETRALLRARQVFVLNRSGSGRYRITIASSLSVVDTTSPTVKWIEARLDHVAAKEAGPQSFVLTQHPSTGCDTQPDYPFRNAMWVPLWSRHGIIDAGLLLVRETPWSNAEYTLALRLAVTYGHAWTLLESPRPLGRRLRVGKRSAWLSGLAALSALALPVPLTALAPAEVVPQGARVIAMPIEGQVQEVLVSPSQRIEKGAPLIRLLDTVWRNKLEIAEREVTVAESRVAKANQLAITDTRGRHELGIARAELALRVAERTYAREMYERLLIRAPAAGIALFSDKKDLLGRPFSVGERLMDIADPAMLELKIELAVSDSLLLGNGARVKAFMDTDPLSHIEAAITRFDYQARLNDSRIAVHRVFADATAGGSTRLRLGARGTAQVHGPRTSLAYLVFRRPITALRQWAGL